jgi:hypothetical protein
MGPERRTELPRAVRPRRLRYRLARGPLESGSKIGASSRKFGHAGRPARQRRNERRGSCLHFEAVRDAFDISIMNARQPFPDRIRLLGPNRVLLLPARSKDPVELALMMEEMGMEEAGRVEGGKSPGDGVGEDFGIRIPRSRFDEEGPDPAASLEPAIQGLGEGRGRPGEHSAGRSTYPDAEAEDQGHRELSHACPEPGGRRATGPIGAGILQEDVLHEAEVFDDLDDGPPGSALLP